MARPIVKPTKPLTQKQGRPKRRATKHAKWGKKEESESVWFSMESKAGRRLEICLPDTRALESLHLGRWNYLQFDLTKNWIAAYSD